MSNTNSSRKKALNDQLTAEVDRIPNDGYAGVLPCEDPGYFPNVDLSIWLRSCIKEEDTPTIGKISGIIPEWLHGK